MECEICGRHSSDMYLISIEGTRMTVCPSCRFHGTLIARKRTEPPRPWPVFKKREHGPEIDIVDNYPELIRGARMEKKMDQEELARKLNEKLSVVKHLEHGKLEPTEKLAKKIERLLGISLLQKIERQSVEAKDGNGSLTLGDIAKMRKK